jgi:hypothetical protein
MAHGGVRVPVNVYLWTAGTAVGVTDDDALARTRAAAAMLANGATAAVVETAHYDYMKALTPGYVRAGGMRWTAARHGDSVTWAGCRADAPRAPAAAV